MPIEAPKRVSQTDRKPHVGFMPSGSSFKSEAPVDNQPTNFVRYVVREIVSDFLSPSDVRFMVLREPPLIRGLFRESTLLSWESLRRFWQWPMAAGSTSAEEFVRSHGGKRLWVTDEWAWTKQCDLAEKRQGYESRVVARADLTALIEGIVGTSPDPFVAQGWRDLEGPPLEG